MVSMYRWKGRSGTDRPAASVDEWRAFVSQVVGRLGDRVDAWGILNEPNHRAYSIATPIACRTAWRRTTLKTPVSRRRFVVTFRKVRKRTGRYVKRTRWIRVHSKRGVRRPHTRGRWRKRITYKRKRRGNYVKRIRSVNLTRRDTRLNRSALRRCKAQTWGAAYRHVWDAVAPVIRQGDPTSTLLLGEFAPAPANRLLLEAMLDARRGRVDADVLGVHPYFRGKLDVRGDGAFNVPNIEATVRFARTHGWTVWATEFGRAPEEANDLVPALDRLESAGVEVTILYDFQATDSTLWDMGVLNPDGSPRPVFQQLIRR
jgi:hypothetical protein